MQEGEQVVESGFINVKIKTLNHSIYDVIANPLKVIRACQNQIQQKTKVPVHSQRLLYRGIVLDPEKTLADYRIEEGNIIQLVANKIPSEYSHQSSVRRSEMNKAHNYSQEHNKTKKYRQLQQRVNGFRLKKQQALQALQQNKHTIDQLIQCVNLNFLKDTTPFRMERRKLEVGEWIDVKDASGQWIQGQVINQYGDYVLIHYNGLHSRWNEWISVSSERIMPFRTHTVQMLTKTPYLSPFPTYERQLSSKNNTNFKTNIETLIYEMTFTLDHISSLIKELEFTNRDYSKQGSLRNVSNIETPQILINQMAQNQNENDQDEQHQRQRKEEFQTPYKESHMVADNSSNICQDDRSSKGVNDDVSSKKSYKSKRSEGLVDTASMKSLKIDESRKRQNKVFLDYSQEAQSVCSMHHKNKLRNVNTFNQEYILQEDSNFNEQEFQEANLLHKKELNTKMKASQLAPLLDRMGRFLIDIAPHFAVLGYTDQLSSQSFNENLSTYTNEGSLLSKLSEANKFTPGNHQFVHSSHSINSGSKHQNMNENNQDDRVLNNFCSFQVPVMLTPHQLVKLEKLIQAEKRNLHIL